MKFWIGKRMLSSTQSHYTDSKKVATAEVFRANYVHPTFLPNVESEDNWVDETDWSDVESGDDDKPNLAEKGRRNYSRNYKRAAEIKEIRDSIPGRNYSRNYKRAAEIKQI